jgi:hypothetical protein
LIGTVEHRQAGCRWKFDLKRSDPARIAHREHAPGFTKRTYRVYVFPTAAAIDADRSTSAIAVFTINVR